MGFQSSRCDENRTSTDPWTKVHGYPQGSLRDPTKFLIRSSSSSSIFLPFEIEDEDEEETNRGLDKDPARAYSASISQRPSFAGTSNRELHHCSVASVVSHSREVRISFTIAK
jgi:hypothetical protein